MVSSQAGSAAVLAVLAVKKSLPNGFRDVAILVMLPSFHVHLALAGSSWLSQIMGVHP